VSATPTDSLAHYNPGGIAFDYPASWTVHDQFPMTSGLGHTIAILGNQPWGPCAPPETDLNCHYDQRLEQGQITVELDSILLANEDICTMGRTRSDLAGRGPGDPVATGSLTRVAGRPTLRTDYAVNGTDYYLSDEWHTWTIAWPGTINEAFVVATKVRGPGLDELDAEVERLIASVVFPPHADHQADDCGAPFPSAQPTPSIEPTASIAPTDDAWTACNAVLTQFTTVDGSAVVAAFEVTGRQYAHWQDVRSGGHEGHAPGATPPFLPFPGIPLDATADVCFMDGYFAVPGPPGPDATRAVIVIHGGFAELVEGGPKEGIAIEDPRLAAWPSPGPVGDALDSCVARLPDIQAQLPSVQGLDVVAGFSVTAGSLVNRQDSVFVFQQLDYHSAWRDRPPDLPIEMCYVNGSAQSRTEQAAGTARDVRLIALLVSDQVVIDSYGPRDNIWVTDPRGWPVPGLDSRVLSQVTTMQLPVDGGRSVRIRIDHGAYQPYFASARPATAKEIAAVEADQLGPIGSSNLSVVHPGGDLFSVIVSWQSSCDTDDRLTIGTERDIYALDEGPRTQCGDAPATRAIVLMFTKHSLAQDAVVEFHPGVVN